MTIRKEIDTIKSAIGSIYDEQEATSIARMVVCNRLNINFSQLVARYDGECEIEGIDNLIAELQNGRPVQYVLGEAEFCDLVFEVCEGVLIPRIETEELVCRIAQEAKPASRILDVGTGSGAIAISLAKRIKDSKVVAMDISCDALAVARRNAERLDADICFVEADALGDFTSLGKFDIIVSNPPYIPQQDEASMSVNVVGYEPHLALFVPDDNALKFYHSIALNSRTMLAEGGKLWFEIYEKYGAEVCAMLSDVGYSRCGVVKDLHQKDRVVWAML